MSPEKRDDTPTVPVGTEMLAPTIEVPDTAALAEGFSEGVLYGPTEAQQSSALKMASLQAPSVDDLLATDIATEMAEAIETSREIALFKTADEFTLRYMKEVVIPSLGLSEKESEAAVAVVERKNHSQVPVEKKGAFLRLSNIQEVISRSMIMHMVDSDPENNRGFRPLEVIELRYGTELANVFDELYIKWEKTAHDIASPDERRAAGFTSKWHIVQGDTESGYKEVPNAEVFPQEHQKISQLLGELIEELKGCEDPDQVTKLAHYEAWKAAHDHSDAEGIKEIWELAEEAFVRQGGRFVIIHPQEEGYGANKTGIIPDTSMRFLLSEVAGEDPVSDGISKRAADMKRLFGPRFEGMSEATQNLDNINPPPLAYFAVNSGLGLVFEIAGQSLPNTMRVQQEVGSLPTINPEAMKKRILEAQAIFRSTFGNRFDAQLAEIDLDEAIVNVAIHEMGHPLSDRDAFLANDMRNGLEEWKATGTEWALMSLDEDYSPEQMRGAFLAEVLHAMRYTQRRAEEAQKPYYIGWQYFMKTAQEVGLIEFSEEAGWDLDLTDEKLVAFAETVTEQWFHVQDMYEAAKQAQNEDDAATLASVRADHATYCMENLVETPFIQELQRVCEEMKQAA